jgi:hypothetical protein
MCPSSIYKGVGKSFFVKHAIRLHLQSRIARTIAGPLDARPPLRCQPCLHTRGLDLRHPAFLLIRDYGRTQVQLIDHITGDAFLIMQMEMIISSALSVLGFQKCLRRDTPCAGRHSTGDSKGRSLVGA